MSHIVDLKHGTKNVLSSGAVGLVYSVKSFSKCFQIFPQHTATHVTYFPLHRVTWGRVSRKGCWLAWCKIWPDTTQLPGASAILHFTFCVLGHTKSSFGILNSKVVWVLEFSLRLHWHTFKVYTLNHSEAIQKNVTNKTMIIVVWLQARVCLISAFKRDYIQMRSDEKKEFKLIKGNNQQQDIRNILLN